MSLEILEKCKSFFDPLYRHQGDDYARRGRAHLIKDSDRHLTVVVQGQDTNFRVNLGWMQLQHSAYLEGNCNCRNFERRGLCEHMWASLAVAKETTFFSAYKGKPLTVRPNRSVIDSSVTEESLQKLFQRGRWREMLLASARAQSENSTQLKAGAQRLAWYALHLDFSEKASKATVQLFFQEEGKRGFGRPKALQFSMADYHLFQDPIDQELLSKLCSCVPQSGGGYFDYNSSAAVSAVQIHQSQFQEIFEMMTKTGRFVLTSYAMMNIDDSLPIIGWKDNTLELRARIVPESDEFGLEFVLWDQESFASEPADNAWIMPNCGLVYSKGQLSPLFKTRALPLLSDLKEVEEFRGPIEDKDDFVSEYLRLAEPETIDIPDDWGWERVKAEALPKLIIRLGQTSFNENTSVTALVDFDYLLDGERIQLDLRMAAVDPVKKKVLEVDLGSFIDVLDYLRFSSDVRVLQDAKPPFEISIRNESVFKVVNELTERGWSIYSEQARLHHFTQNDFKVEESSRDWFGIKGSVRFGDRVVEIPEILRQLHQNKDYIQLSDGSVGLLPKKWLKAFRKLSELSGKNGELEISKDHSLLLDLLLSQIEPNPLQNQALQRQLSQLQRLTTPVLSEPDQAFKGELRAYQKQGLGWMEVLREFGMGGCLADDMGLGKTVQVLALLQKYRNSGKTSLPPDLIIAPKSLVLNWLSEIKKFTPDLNVLEYTGPDRESKNFAKYDIVLTTYGTLRRDILKLKDFEFYHIILDEAHAIKNANSQSAKACRLLNGRYRIALTGTPIENRMSELASLFQFLNPAFMGTKLHSVIARESRGAEDENETWRGLVLKAIRPFVLRRTKRGVLPELPEKSEEVIFCQLSKSERKEYDQLRDWYRANLSESIATHGIDKSRMHVLEALLRLRQAACHRGLLAGSDESKEYRSAKLDALVDMLEDLVQSHKVLVFSQFTSLLKIVEKRLRKKEWKFCYLDGKMSARKRQEEVDRFQNDNESRIFLLSLKAGGHGLNLTAAEYCFLLDPWWNPAAEAQAIDRMHRIGQKKSVYAFRMIAKDTVEEKILALQQSKRELADEFWTTNSGGLAELSQNEILDLFS